MLRVRVRVCALHESGRTQSSDARRTRRRRSRRVAGRFAATAAGSPRSVLARKQDRVVREVQRDLVEREVRVFELLAEDHAAIAVVAG
jgi:hypothetical protein